jgi:hypothetical protein
LAKLATLTAASSIPTRTIDITLAGSATASQVGIRLLSATEAAGVYQRAKRAARELGSEVWDQDDPICELELYVETVAACTFDIDGPDGSFEPWATAAQLRDDRSIGQENLALLFEAYRAFEEEHAIRPEDLKGETFLTTVMKAGGGDLRPLERMRRRTLVAFTASLAAQLRSSTIATWLSSSASESSAGSTPTTPSAPV